MIWPELASWTDWSLLALRLTAAVVFLWSGLAHARDPKGRGESIGVSPGVALFLGIAEMAGARGRHGILIQPASLGLILVMLGAVQKKIFVWKTGFWGEKASGWHSDLMFIAMNFVLLTMGGGRLVLVGAIGDLIDASLIQVCCVDSVDSESFYATNRPPPDRIRRHDQYDHYLANEVVPFARSRAPMHGRVATLGASFGAYHAVNFGFRHPDLVDKVVGFSGKYDVDSFLDGYWDELCYFHCPTANVPSMDGEWVGRLNSMDIAIVTGETDNILEAPSR